MIEDVQVDRKPTLYVANNNEDEIDLIGVAKTLWKGKKIIFISIGVCLIIGLITAITTPNEYTVSTVMVPQTGTDVSKSQLSGLASLAGLNIGMAQTNDLSPLLYPKIVNSIPFKLELMNIPIQISDLEKPVSVFEYYTKYKKKSIFGAVKRYTFGLPGLLLGSFSKKPKDLLLPSNLKNKPILLSKQQFEVKKILDGLISLTVEKKEGYLTLTVKMPEAMAAAELTQKAQELLQREIIKFKVEKSKADLDFIQERYNVAKAEAESYQVNVAVNTDRFKNLTSSLPQISTSRIQAKYGIANGVYQELAKQLEQAKIQVKKDTPVFTIIEPVSVPIEKSKPRRSQIIIIWLVIGVIIGIVVIYVKNLYFGIKQKWSENDLK